MSTSYPIPLEIFNRQAVDALEFMEEKLLDLSITDRRMYFDLVPRGTYPLGQGIVRKQHRFHRDVGDQAGLLDWTNIQTGREPSGDDAGYDACTDLGTLVGFGTETVEYTGFRRGLRTPDYCINDFKFKWEFEQQLALRVQHLAEITRETWENESSEGILHFAGQAGRIFVLTNAFPWDVPLSTNYNPFVSTDMVIPNAARGLIQPISKEALEFINDDLGIQAFRGRVAGTSEDPILGLDVDKGDFARSLERQSDRREDLRTSQWSDVLVEGYAKVKTFYNWAMMWNRFPIRYDVKAGGIGASTTTLKRIVPYTLEPTTIGFKPVINPDYRKAEFGLMRPFLKNVFENLVPPPGPASIAKMQYGVVPDLMGDFAWLNYKSDSNPYGEKGKFTARLQAFMRPLECSEWACAFLYRRCLQTPTITCAPSPTTSGDWIVITAATPLVDTDAGETATSYTRVTVTLDAFPSCDAALASLTVDEDGDGGNDATAYIVNDADAPTYVIAFSTAADWVDAAAIVAGTSRVKCS